MLMLLIVVARWGKVGIVTGVVVFWPSALDHNIFTIFGVMLCPEIKGTWSGTFLCIIIMWNKALPKFRATWSSIFIGSFLIQSVFAASGVRVHHQCIFMTRGIGCYRMLCVLSYSCWQSAGAPAAEAGALCARKSWWSEGPARRLLKEDYLCVRGSFLLSEGDPGVLLQWAV